MYLHVTRRRRPRSSLSSARLFTCAFVLHLHVLRLHFWRCVQKGIKKQRRTANGKRRDKEQENSLARQSTASLSVRSTRARVVLGSWSTKRAQRLIRGEVERISGCLSRESSRAAFCRETRRRILCPVRVASSCVGESTQDERESHETSFSFLALMTMQK